MPTLYEIDQAIADTIEVYMDQETGELSEEAFEALEALGELRETKIENVALYYKDILATAEAIKKEADQLTARRKVYENKAEGLKRYLEMATNGQKFETSRVVIRYRRSEAVDIIDEAKIPEEYLTVKVTETPNKKLIKDAIKAGQAVTGAILTERQNIQIK
jgi:hypothetical protein